MLTTYLKKPLPTVAKSLLFYTKGKAKVGDVPTPIDILEKNGRWSVAIKPLVVGLCPSDMAGGMLEFPLESMRSFINSKEPAIAGHEFVGQVIGATAKGVLALRKRGIKVGDIVAGDINVGCGSCAQCKRGDPPVYCAKGATFLGVGSSPSAEGWVKEQTGWRHLPGAYTEGFVVLPPENVYKVPPQAIKNKKNLPLFSQADAVACAKTSCDTMGLTTFRQLRGVEAPKVLVIGAGRLGTWHIAVMQDLLPKAEIYIADIKKESLARAGRICGIPTKRHYYVTGKDAFTPKRLAQAFGADTKFDFIIDTAGHGVLTGATITEMLLHLVAQGGKFWTTAHTGIAGVDAGHPLLLLGSKSFGNGLSPQNNFPYAISFLTKHSAKYAKDMVEIPHGLSGELAEIVATGGHHYKTSAHGTLFCSVITQPTI